jgi:hypothetical protein
MKITINNIDDVLKSKIKSIETAELEGYELIDNLFVDNSGFGQENEPALTYTGFMKELEAIIKKYKSIYTFITDVGQFQVYLGVFTKTGKKTAKRLWKLSKNLMRIETKTGYIIRLYDTDIFEVKNNKIILNSGGFDTPTTRKWINHFLYKEGINAYVYQKDFEQYISNQVEGLVYPHIINK